MELSRFKWPLIIVAAIFAGWLMTDAGTAWLYGRFTDGPVGEDEAVDARNEAGLSKLGGYLMKTFRYERAAGVLRAAVERYPQGKNAWYNRYRLVKCAEKQENYFRAVEMLDFLIWANAHEKDPRVPENAVLKGRAETLREVHDLGGPGMGI